MCFILFCLVSGCVYILNDLVDLKVDRMHPTKKHRPLASGRLSRAVAVVVGSVLLGLSLILASSITPYLTCLLVVYFLLNIGYSLYLKHVAIVDVFLIAMGFVIRAAAGGISIGVSLTPWFLCCTMMLSLFLAIGKRRQEYVAWKDKEVQSRKVLSQYSLELLNQLSNVSAASVLMTYSMFTFAPGHSRYLMLTIPIVMYGLFRYYQVMFLENQGERPEVTLFKDRHILVSMLLFSCVVTIVLCTTE